MRDVTDFACPRCAAGVGVWCKTKNGNYAPKPHGDRLQLARDEATREAGYCPVHGMRDCSPLLNGCAALTGGGRDG